MRSVWIGEVEKMCVGRRMHELCYCLLKCPTCIGFPACVSSLACVHLRQRFVWVSVCSCINMCICTSTCVRSNLPAGVENIQTLRPNWAERINNDERRPSQKGHRWSLNCLHVSPFKCIYLPQQRAKADRAKQFWFSSAKLHNTGKEDLFLQESRTFRLWQLWHSPLHLKTYF